MLSQILPRYYFSWNGFSSFVLIIFSLYFITLKLSWWTLDHSIANKIQKFCSKLTKAEWNVFSVIKQTVHSFSDFYDCAPTIVLVAFFYNAVDNFTWLYYQQQKFWSYKCKNIQQVIINSSFMTAPGYFPHLVKGLPTISTSLFPPFHLIHWTLLPEFSINKTKIALFRTTSMILNSLVTHDTAMS